MSKFDDFVTASTAANTALGAALDNVIADQANLLKQIVDLKAQIGAGLSPAQEAQLDAVITSMTASASKAQTLADSVPDLPPPPPPPGS